MEPQVVLLHRVVSFARASVLTPFLPLSVQPIESEDHMIAYTDTLVIEESRLIPRYIPMHVASFWDLHRYSYEVDKSRACSHQGRPCLSLVTRSTSGPWRCIPAIIIGAAPLEHHATAL